MKKKVVNYSLVLILAFFTILMVRITVPYLAFEDDVAFLMLKQWVIENKVWKTAFYLHVLTSCFALLAGFTQFSDFLLKKYRVVHRWVGKSYLVIVVFLSGPSGFIMALYANGGWVAQVAFILLSLLWVYTTIKAYSSIRKGDIEAHESFMVRSYALTLSALTLRAWKWVLVLLFRPHPMEVYMLVAWLGWVPNLLVAEWYIRTYVVRKKLIR